MVLRLGGQDFSLKCRYQALKNLRDKAKDIRYTEHSKARLPDDCSTPLQEKLVAPMTL